MEGFKTKAKSYVNEDNYCIAGISAIPENGFYRIYVAWEWEDMAKKKVFAVVRSRTLFKTVDKKSIRETADYGSEINDWNEIKKIMPWII